MTFHEHPSIHYLELSDVGMSYHKNIPGNLFFFLLHILNEIDDGNKTKFEGIQVKIKILIIFVTWTGELTY